MIVVLLGPPGSGKGTQASMLAEKLKLPHVVVGEILREAVRQETELGQQAKAFLDKGLLVPNDLVIEVTNARLREKDCDQGMVIDGYPRTVQQADALAKIVQEKGQVIDRVIYLKIAEDEVVRRLSERRSCRNCNKVYHLVYNPPKTADKCDACQGGLYQRDDDKEVIIRKRFEVYLQNTAVLVDYYRKQGSLREVENQGTVEAVFQAVLKAL